MREKKAYWIQKTHVFGADEYICSNCGNSEKTMKKTCPKCNARMTKSKYDPSWVDEMEWLDIFDD